jgi:NAD(P)H-dependent FMN reductase
MDEVHVAGISGSLRDDSYTRVGTDRVLSAAAAQGATTDCIDLRRLELPVFDADDREVGDSAELKRRVRAADALVLATPVYHGSYSGAIRNALDYCGFDEFRDTTVGLLATSGGGLPGGTFEHMAAIAHTLNAWVLPRMAAIPSAYDHIDDGEVVDDDTADRLDDLGGALVTWAGIESPER